MGTSAEVAREIKSTATSFGNLGRVRGLFEWQGTVVDTDLIEGCF